MHGTAKILDTDLNYCQPPWVCIVPIDLFVKVSRLSQFFHSWLVLQLPCDNAHVNVDKPANNIDYLLCIFLFYKQKEQGTLGESGILDTTSMASCSRRKE